MPVHRDVKHTPAVRAAKYRKWKANFHKITGGAFDEAWDPSVDRNGSFAKDQLSMFTKWANEDPSKLQAYYNQKRADVINAHNEGKNLVDYGRDENGKLVHFLEGRDGELSFAAQEFNKGGNNRLEQAKNNIINQARERVILGLATKADLKELYRYDHAGPVHQNSISEQLDNAFDQLFDNDFFDGFRYGFGSVLQLGAPLFDYVPGGEGASEYIDEAGKFIQGDIDSVDTIINRQNLRAEKRDPGGTYENDIVKRVVPFDPAAAAADDLINKQEAEERFRAQAYSGEKMQEYNDAAVESYKQSQGITDEEYDRRALPEAEFNKKYAQTPDNEDVTATPMLPEGEEFKQAPLEENNDAVDDNIANNGPQSNASNADLGAINTKLDKLQTSVDEIINRAKARKAKHESGGSIMKGSGPGDDEVNQGREPINAPRTEAERRHLTRQLQLLKTELARRTRFQQRGYSESNMFQMNELIELIANLSALLRDHQEGGQSGGKLDANRDPNEHFQWANRADHHLRNIVAIRREIAERGITPERLRLLAQSQVGYNTELRYLRAGRHNDIVQDLERRLSEGGALGNRKRKRNGRQGGPESIPAMPADRMRLQQLLERLSELAFEEDDNADPDEEARIEAEIAEIERRAHANGQDFNRGGEGLLKRRRGAWRQ